MVHLRLSPPPPLLNNRILRLRLHPPNYPPEQAEVQRRNVSNDGRAPIRIRRLPDVRFRLGQ